MYGTKQNISFYFTKQTSLFLLSYLKFCRLKPAVSTILIILSVCVRLINNSNTHHRLLIMSNRIREGAQTPSALNTFNMNHLQSASDRTAGHLTSLTVLHQHLRDIRGSVAAECSTVFTHQSLTSSDFWCRAGRVRWVFKKQMQWKI